MTALTRPSELDLPSVQRRSFVNDLLRTEFHKYVFDTCVLVIDTDFDFAGSSCRASSSNLVVNHLLSIAVALYSTAICFHNGSWLFVLVSLCAISLLGHSARGSLVCLLLSIVRRGRGMVVPCVKAL